jgi:hypothetical protein
MIYTCRLRLLLVGAEQRSLGVSCCAAWCAPLSSSRVTRAVGTRTLLYIRFLRRETKACAHRSDPQTPAPLSTVYTQVR